MKRREPKLLGDIMDEMFDAAGLNPTLNRHKIEAAWPVVAGPGIAAYSSGVRVDGSNLHVTISSAALKEELMYLRAMLVNQLNSHVGTEVINNIIIH